MNFNMEMTNENKLEILQITLDCIKESDKHDAFIIVDFETVEYWLDHLEILERFEDCYLIKENVYKFVHGYSEELIQR